MTYEECQAYSKLVDERFEREKFTYGKKVYSTPISRFDNCFRKRAARSGHNPIRGTRIC